VFEPSLLSVKGDGHTSNVTDALGGGYISIHVTGTIPNSGDLIENWFLRVWGAEESSVSGIGMDSGIHGSPTSHERLTEDLTTKNPFGVQVRLDTFEKVIINPGNLQECLKRDTFRVLHSWSRFVIENLIKRTNDQIMFQSQA
jgi:hypothetical protein